MIEFMQNTFGTYYQAEGVWNFEYIGAVAIFCICLIGVFKVLTAIFRRK